MPNFGPGTRSLHGVPMVATSQPSARGFANPQLFPVFPERPFLITGISRDSVGAVLGNCTVDLYTNDKVFSNTTTSDGSGNYSFQVADGTKWFIRAYLVGSPDRAGTSKNDLQGS